MSIEKMAAFIMAGIVIFVLLAASGVFTFKLQKRRKRHGYFLDKWKLLQNRCANKEEWPNVLAEADKLLDEALKKRNIKGKTMGARMVAAQRLFTDNDGVWFGHKLRVKYESTPKMTLDKDSMKQALTGLRQGLKDLGVL